METKKDDDRDLYLPEDQKLLNELEENDVLNLGINSEGHKKQLQITQIKASLRSRKSFDKFDKATTRFSIILAAFAIIQIIIALMQFLLDAINSSSTYPWRVLSVVILCAGFVILVLRSFNKILSDK